MPLHNTRNPLVPFFKLTVALTNLWKLLSVFLSTSSLEITSHSSDDSNYIWCSKERNHIEIILHLPDYISHCTPCLQTVKTRVRLLVLMSYNDCISQHNLYLYIKHNASTILGIVKIIFRFHNVQKQIRNPQCEIGLFFKMSIQTHTIWFALTWTCTLMVKTHHMWINPWWKSFPTIAIFAFFVCWNYAEHLFQQITYLKQSTVFVFVKTFFATGHSILNAFCHSLEYKRGKENGARMTELIDFSDFQGKQTFLFILVMIELSSYPQKCKPMVHTHWQSSKDGRKCFWYHRGGDFSLFLYFKRREYYQQLMSSKAKTEKSLHVYIKPSAKTS